MLHALISQRQELNKYGDSIDSLETTYVKFFNSLNVSLVSVPNLNDNLEKVADFKLLILSGGGIISNEHYRYNVLGFHQNERNAVEHRLISLCLKRGIPIVGICRGMHQLNAYFGGKVSSFEDLIYPRHVRSDHPIRLLDSKKVVYVNNFHQDGIMNSDLGAGLYPVAIDPDNLTIEAFRSEKYNILGIQWHPERHTETEDGYKVGKELILSVIHK